MEDNDLNETIQRMGKTIEFLQSKCRQAGKAILDLNNQNEGLKKEIDRLSEENSNLRVMFRDDTE